MSMFKGNRYGLGGRPDHLRLVPEDDAVEAQCYDGCLGSVDSGPHDKSKVQVAAGRPALRLAISVVKQELRQVRVDQFAAELGLIDGYLDPPEVSLEEALLTDSRFGIWGPGDATAP